MDSDAEPRLLEGRPADAPQRLQGDGLRGTTLAVGRLARRLLVLAGVAGCSTSLPKPPEPAGTESARCVQDVEYALAALEEIHPRIFNSTPRTEFQAEIKRLKSTSPPPPWDESFLSLMRLVALAGDSHTCLTSWDEVTETVLPIAIESWSDGYWIAGAQPDQQHLFGRRVVSIEGVPIAVLVTRLGPFVPHENDAQLRAGGARAATLPRLLRAVGVAGESDRVRLRLADRNRKQEDVLLAPLPRESLADLAFYAPGGDWKPPMFRERWLEDWWWKTIDDDRALYLQYNRCLARKDHPFAETASACLERIDHDPRIERVFIDLRNNGGGDSRVLRPLIDGLRRRARRMPGSRIYVAIGLGTYSSGMLNAWQMKRDLHAVLVGEPTLQKPDGFGEVRTFALPNTGWRVNCSTERIRVFGDERPALEPDVRVPFGFANVLEGEDPVVDWFLAQRNPVH